ncbi:helix-turn-helix domain-containing protein [Euzebya tangerina]|uniref:helix-turn-helix domain-containing protein n=1 Tax=Euzebya tangerina TaxID=591198 RepID=UPI000E313C28|nr:helix-turn-helix domain-containing protein [Euzebya tangerina]
MSALPLDIGDPVDTPVRSILDRQLLTVAEVAEYLRVSEMTVYRLISSREIGATKVGRCWRVPADDLMAYLDEQHVTKAP